MDIIPHQTRELSNVDTVQYHCHHKQSTTGHIHKWCLSLVIIWYTCCRRVAQRFSMFSHIETDAKKILILYNWRRPPGRPRTTRMKLSSKTWDPITFPWVKQLMWLRIIHSGDWCQCLVLLCYTLLVMYVRYECCICYSPLQWRRQTLSEHRWWASEDKTIPCPSLTHTPDTPDHTIKPSYHWQKRAMLPWTFISLIKKALFI